MRLSLTKEEFLKKIEKMGVEEGSKIAVGVNQGGRGGIKCFIGEFKISDRGILLGTKCRNFDFHNITNVGRVVDEKRRLVYWVS